MIRTPVPTLDPNYVYSIQDLEDSEEYSLCIYAKDEAIHYDDNTPLASFPLDDYPEDFEQEIWEAILKLASVHSEYYTNTPPDTYHFYTQALYSTVSEDEIR